MKTLVELYNIHAKSGREYAMVDYIDRTIKKLGAETYRDEFNNLYATKGMSETYPCIVAHTDEVHGKRSKHFAVMKYNDILFGFDSKKNAFCGIGADDKNGIWIALKCFEMHENIKAAFFVSEEIGCIGSGSADMSFFDDCRFVIQCDRMHGNDFIVNAAGVDLCGDDFIDDCDMELFGYFPEYGSITDVMQLKLNGLGVSCCNLSCGYYNPHTNNELTRISELKNCLAFVEHIISRCSKVYPHSCIDDEQYYNIMKNEWDVERYYDIRREIEYYALNTESPNFVSLSEHIKKIYPDATREEITTAFNEVLGEQIYYLTN